MRLLSIMGLSIIGAVLSGTGPARAFSGDRRQIVLFGARWCAPCMLEYQNLPALVAASAPDRLILAWVDKPLAAPPVLSSQVQSMPLNDARQLARAIAGEGYGLPFSAMLDASGKPCVVVRAPLHPADLPLLHARCSTPPIGTR
jgi:thiol-disulfide isomerase/thioredoxin